MHREISRRQAAHSASVQAVVGRCCQSDLKNRHAASHREERPMPVLCRKTPWRSQSLPALSPATWLGDPTPPHPVSSVRVRTEPQHLEAKRRRSASNRASLPGCKISRHQVSTVERHEGPAAALLAKLKVGLDNRHRPRVSSNQRSGKTFAAVHRGSHRDPAAKRQLRNCCLCCDRDRRHHTECCN